MRPEVRCVERSPDGARADRLDHLGLDQRFTKAEQGPRLAGLRSVVLGYVAGGRDDDVSSGRIELRRTAAARRILQPLDTGRHISSAPLARSLLVDAQRKGDIHVRPVVRRLQDDR